MRILGFSKKWDKLGQNQFTTFRFTRKDKDWQVGELVRVVYKPRSKGGGEKLGTAKIVDKYAVMILNIEPPDLICPIGEITEEDAIFDGFRDKREMFLWLWGRYKKRIVNEPMNKLTLKWVERNAQ